MKCATYHSALLPSLLNTILSSALTILAVSTFLLNTTFDICPHVIRTLSSGQMFKILGNIANEKYKWSKFHVERVQCLFYISCWLFPVLCEHHVLYHLPKWMRRLVNMTRKVSAPSSIGLSCSESNTAFWCWDAMVNRSTTLNLRKWRHEYMMLLNYVELKTLYESRWRNKSSPLKNTWDEVVRI